jgi:micrococcal nuclease
MYEYRATLLKVVDGDTVDLRVDLGFSVHVEERFRLLGINTPEMSSKDATERARAQAATKYMADLMSKGPVTIRTKKDESDKYGRMLATIVNGAGVVVNEEMIRAGHAVAYDGGKR